MTPQQAFIILVLVMALAAICATAGALWIKARAAAALREATRDREHLMELAEHWIWRTDAEHRLRLWRPPAHRSASWSDTPELGARLDQIAHLPDESRTVALDEADAGASDAYTLIRPLNAHAPIAAQRLMLRIGDQQRLWTLRGLPRFNGAGEFIGYVGSATPADPVEAAPLECVTACETAPPSDPVAESADHESFIYSVSHDLRAPIRVVEGFARILKEDYGRHLDRIGNDHTDRILAAAARMNSMIDALLALSQLQSQPLKRQPVDLSQLAHYVLEDLRTAQPERELDLAIEPGLIVQGDPTLLRIAIDNLIGNAWKYSAQKPRTRIELRREPSAGKNAYVVADNGAGFDMRFADRLFGVFQRLHSAKDFQGTGVGLASVRRIVRRHGGDIWAQSEVGHGAKFYFTLA